MKDSTEALATSQLETLYRLGILKRNSEDGESVESRKKERSQVYQHDAFLAALPPPSAVFPMNLRHSQAFSNESESSRHSSGDRSRESYAESSDGVSSNSRHRQSYKSRRVRSSAWSEGSSALPMAESAKRDRRALRMLFRQWRQFVRNRRQEARRRAAADVLLKQKILTIWARFLLQRRYENDKQRLFDSWRVCRAISRWVHWNKRCRLLRSLLDGSRRSFMGKLIQQRVWRRWIQFAKRRKYIHGILVRRTRCIDYILLQNVWCALRINVHQARQARFALRRCFKSLCSFRFIQERRRLLCSQYHEKVNLKRKCELLNRWRAFAYKSGRERRLACRVQFDVRRRRYFLLWCEVARATNLTGRLRAKILFRVLRKHLLAWDTTTKAIQLGDQVTKSREKHLRALYFEALKDQARLSALSHRAQLCLARRRQAIAVENLKSWVRERRRRREGIYWVQQKWQARLLRCAWSEGWLKIYRKRQARKQSCLAREARYLRVWKLFNRNQQIYYHQQERAVELYSKFCCQRALANWKCYYQYRLDHKQQLVKAQQHHRKVLLQQGVTCLWGALYQNTQNSLRGHQLRHKLRVSLKTRHFRAWQSLSRSRKNLADRLNRLQKSPGYQKSNRNPIRRKWNRWIIFVSMCQQRHRCEQLFQLRTKRRVLLIWRQHVILESRLRDLGFHKSRKLVGTFFAHWKCRVEKWRKVSAICELAERVHERKLCTRVIRGWHRRSTYYQRIRLCSESVQHQRDAKLHATYFFKWQEEFHSCQRISRLRRSHVQRQLRACFTKWYKHSTQQKMFIRKLAHFQQVFGRYPASSTVSRAWRHWQQASKLSKCVKLLHRKHQLRQALQCWSRWKGFHAVCQLIRGWHCVARTMSSGNNKLGARIRLFRESRRHRLQVFTIKKWKCLVQRMRNFQERQSLCKHQLHRELEGVTAKSQRAKLFHLRNWVRRWQVSCNKKNSLADNYFRVRLVGQVLLGWWKKTIHSKQEKLLVEAQQALGKLSYYHPQQQAYIAEVKRAKTLKREKKTPKGKVKAVCKEARAESMRRMRRMLDPTENPSYAQTYQDSGKEVSRAELLNTKPAVTSVVLHADNSAFGHIVSDSEPCREILGNRVHFADSKHWKAHQNVHHHAVDGGRSCFEVTKEAIHGQPIVNHNSHRSVSIVRNEVLLHRLDINNSNQLRPVPGPILQSQECSHQDEYQIIPEDSKPEDVLPLFDKELTCMNAFDQKEKIYPIQRATTAEYPIEVAPNVQHSPCTQQQDQFDSNTIISEPAFDHYRRDSNLRGHNSGVNGPRRVTPVVFKPSSSLPPVSEGNKSGRHGKPHIKTRHRVHTMRGKVVNICRSNESRPLADILELNDNATPKLPELENGSTDGNENPVWDTSTIREILGFYADSVLAHADDNTLENGMAKMKVTRMSACYRIARDLALLQNDFYIDEIQKVCNANFREKYIELPRNATDADKIEEQMKFERFLEELIERHPAYRKYLIGLRQNNSRSPIPMSPFTWLAQRHLQPHVSLHKRSKSRLRKMNMYWVWEPMPADMALALEKLLPAITKYMRILGQFFLRQAVQRFSSTERAQEYRISSTALIALLKQVRCFPQLFHRRELENAVKLSACSSPDTEELNFPEFIETLVRCSSKLRWGELDGCHHTQDNKSDDTVVVIKFVMLIFAMEGQGSVLKKRNEDIGVILGFLGQQHKKKQAEKLYRFRKMLADNMRRTRESRNEPPSSVWNQVRLQYSPKRSPTRSHDTIDELTESWDGGSPQHISTEPFVFYASTNEPFALDSSPPPSAEAFHHQSGLQPRQECVREESVQIKPPGGSIEEVVLNRPISAEETSLMQAGKICESHCQASVLSLTSTESSQQPDVSKLDAKLNVLETERSELIKISDRQVETLGLSMNVNDDTSISVNGHERESQTTTRSAGLAEPMEKDEFLLDILNSIGDVEMLLSQSQFSGSDLSRQDNRKVRRTYSSLSDVSSDKGIPSLSDLAASSASYNHFGDITVASSEYIDSEGDPDIPVRDPMLNYLTDVDRFTETSDSTSLLSIADMAGIPFAQDSVTQDQSDLDAGTSAQQETTAEPGNTATQPSMDDS